MHSTKYEEDFYGWAVHTAQLLREKRMDEVDFENIIEEIESLGRKEKHELTNRLSQLMFHLLKWKYQPDFRGRSWEGSIETQREDIQELLKDNPSLKHKTEEIFPLAYKRSKSMVKKETPIDMNLLPEDFPYTFDQIMDDEFFPN